MSGRFRAIVAALWQRLGLPPPRFGEDGRTRLSVDSVGLELFDDDRGSLVVEAIAGTLEERGRPAREQQIRRILETSCGFLLTCRADVYLKTLPAGGDSVVVRASHAYSLDDAQGLTAKIEDVVWLVELYRAELGDIATRQVPQAPARSATETQSALIFRP